jgi:hypothetical protein
MDREKVIKDNAIRGLQSAIEISGALVHLRKEHAKAILELLKEQEAVVRCKDCKHFDGIDCRVNDIVNIMDTDWFCADAWKRDSYDDAWKET